MMKKKPTKKNNGKLSIKKTKRKSFRKAGANTPSPRTLKAIKIQRVQREHTRRVRTRKVIKIQSHQRGHTVRKPKYIDRESTNFKSLIGEGAAKFKKKIQDLHIRGLNLIGIKLSAKPLQGIDLIGANLTEAKLNGTKLNGAKLNGANFRRAELKKTILIEANLTNANFNAANLDSTDFTGANLTRAKFHNAKLMLTNFTGANLTEAIFLNITVSKANLPIFKNTNLTRATLDRLEYISKNNGNILTELTIKGIIREYDLRLEDMELRNSTLLDIRLTVSKLKRVNFSGSTMSKMTLDHSTISDCNFQNITSNLIVFDTCVIDNCNFSNAKLVGVKFIACTFTNPIWTNADLTNTLFTGSPLKGLNFEGATLVNADFRYQNLSGTNFRNANLTQAHFNALQVNGLLRPVTFDIHTNFEGATLTSADFQEAIGLERHNFDGITMNGALFVGCDLTGSTFRGADVRHVQFYYADLTDCDFTDALVDNALYDGSTQGTDSAVGFIRGVRQEQIPTDIHKAWAHVLKNETFIFLSNRVSTRTIKPTTAITMGRYINQTLQDLITNSSDIEQMKKVELTDQLNICKASYESWDYMGILPGTNPPITYGDLAFATLEFVKSERDEFKNIYLEELLGENVNAHGEGGLSCAKGMAERIVVKLIVPAQGMTTLAPERRFYYNQLINLVEPLYRLPEDEAAEIAKADYVDVEISSAFSDEWHNLHKVDGKEPFQENTTLPDIIKNYKAFLEEKFKDVVMSPDKRLELNSNIDIAIEQMELAIKFYDKHEEYFEGGSSRRKKHNYTRIFSMSTREFRKLFSKSKKLTLKNG